MMVVVVKTVITAEWVRIGRRSWVKIEPRVKVWFRIGYPFRG
jgi:hypothetical protein